MNWTEYPTKDARDAKRNGVEMSGQYVSPAAPSGKWYVTGDQKIHRVRELHGVSYCLAPECPAGQVR